MPEAVTFRDVINPGCPCLCDDLHVRVQEGKITAVQGDCASAQPWFEAAARTDRPAALVSGQAAEWSAAVEAAATILREARAPLVTGIIESGMNGQRGAVELADRIGAFIDPAVGPPARAMTRAMQQVGLSTCTLGEVRQRADLIISWRCGRFGTDPCLARKLLASDDDGRARDVTVVRVTENQQLSADDRGTLAFDEADDLAVITQLRLWLRTGRMPGGGDAGTWHRAAQELAERISRCRSGVLLWDGTPSETGTLEALLRLVAELNDARRFALLPVGGLTGAEQVLCWQTGYSASVSFQHGFPQYGPTEATANALLERDAVDAIVLIGESATRHLSPAALARLHGLPVIALMMPQETAPIPAAVEFCAEPSGLRESATFYRFDGVPLHAPALLPRFYPTAAETLGAIGAACAVIQPASR